MSLRGELVRPLTLRERQVLAAYIVTGTNEKAAKTLRVATSTVKNHLSAIHRKTGTRSTVQSLYVMGLIDKEAVMV